MRRPVDRIVRCDLELDRERATPDIEIIGYDMLASWATDWCAVRRGVGGDR